jgi:hypothetical protein
MRSICALLLLVWVPCLGQSLPPTGEIAHLSDPDTCSITAVLQRYGVRYSAVIRGWSDVLLYGQPSTFVRPFAEIQSEFGLSIIGAGLQMRAVPSSPTYMVVARPAEPYDELVSSLDGSSLLAEGLERQVSRNIRAGERVVKLQYRLRPCLMGDLKRRTELVEGTITLSGDRTREVAFDYRHQ